MGNELIIFKEHGLMVVAMSVLDYTEQQKNGDFARVLRKKCESEEYFLWGAYEEICKVHNTIVRAIGLDSFQVNGDMPPLPEPTKQKKSELTGMFWREFVFPNIGLFPPDDPTILALKGVNRE